MHAVRLVLGTNPGGQLVQGLLGSAENEMPVHATQVTLAASGTEPGVQKVHTPLTSTLPVGQRAQEDAPGPEVRPTPQSRQVDRPELGVYLPAVQGPHAVVLTLYWPAAHRVHTEVPGVEMVPAWQLMQEDAPSEGE